MNRNYDFGSVNLDVSVGRERAAKPAADDPFRIAILGDFSGSGATKRKPVLIDRDNFEDVFREFGVSLELPVAGRISFAELDDFHPDRLYERVSLFEPLRRALAEPGSPKASAPTANAAPPAMAALSFDSLLEDAMQATESRHEEKTVRDPLRAWISEKAAPYTTPPVPAADSERRELITGVIAAQMRALLHYPDFQQLEALWRAIYFLVRRTDTDNGLSIRLVDVSRDELAQSLDRVRELLGAHGPWSLFVGGYSFGAGEKDLQALAALGATAAQFNASFLSAAEPRLIGCESIGALSDPTEWLPVDAAWNQFRSSPAAGHVGLALPRFLLRQPYGAKTDPCERISFEEMGTEHDHDRLLWGNPAILCACLLADSFEEEGWRMRPGKHSNIGGLPVYVYQEDGEAVAQPCAESVMTERAAQEVLNRGVMCIASLKDTDEVRLVRFQSVTKPPTPLAGLWQ
jgi:type VI secretion system protein ImpC